MAAGRVDGRGRLGLVGWAMRLRVGSVAGRVGGRALRGGVTAWLGRSRYLVSGGAKPNWR